MRYLAKSFLLLIPAALAACSQYGYHYPAHPQHPMNPVFLDYRQKGDTTDILVDTNGFRLETLSILKPDGIAVRPTSIDFPKFEDQLMPSQGVLIHGPSFANGPTIAHFKTSAIGPPPWQVHLSIQGQEAQTATVGH